MFGVALLLAAASVPVDPGPEPTWEQAIQLGDQALAERLVDPESARIAWPYGFFGGSLKGLLGKRQAGWITCGEVNARNRMGGYTGAVPFLIVIHNGAVVELDIGEPDGVDSASATCPGLVKKGLIRASGASTVPAPVPATAVGALSQQAVEAAAKGSVGIAWVSSTAGLVLLAVAPGSPAAAAGLKVGQVIQRANGIDLRGMPQEAAVALLHALPSTAELDLVGGSKVELKHP